MKKVLIQNPTIKKASNASQTKDLEKKIKQFFSLINKAKLSNIIEAPITIALGIINTAIDQANNILRNALKKL